MATDPALIGWQRLGGWWRAALPWKTDRIGNAPIATLGTEQRHCSHTVTLELLAGASVLTSHARAGLPSQGTEATSAAAKSILRGSDIDRLKEATPPQTCGIEKNSKL